MLQAHEKYYRISISARSSRSLARLLLHGVYRLLRLNRLSAIITHLNDRISPEFLEIIYRKSKTTKSRENF